MHRPFGLICVFVVLAICPPLASAQDGSFIQTDLDSTMFSMGVTAGGLDREFRFSGHNDYVLNFDLGKAGVQEGLFVKVRAEHRFGESLGGATGALLPSNFAADLPVPDSDEVYITNLLITQMFSPNFGVFLGKLDTLDGDRNAFAHGRGKTQFSNVAFVVNPATFRTIPYSTLGAGFVYLSDAGEPLFTFTVLNARETIRTSGFDELFEDGVALSAEGRLPTNFFDLPGHQLVGGTWNSRDYVGFGQDPRVIFPNVPIQRQTGSWSLYWNFDQYLFAQADDATKGVGVFGRAAIADDETNPIESFLSFGIGGNSLIPSRPNDTFGIGWYKSYTTSEIGPLLNFFTGGLGDGEGIEAYYDIAVTEWLHITPDIQWIRPARNAVDDATVMGVRGRIIF